ncbi:MAG TPA: cytochrome c3 family protein [Anaerolineales bacterium]|nr:cytochrome c3 family protein [Anaerolineales bacterium]
MKRFGFVTASGLIMALLVPVVSGAAALATGGGIFSAGPLNAQSGPTPVGGAWAHADLACSDCHTPFWSNELMGDRCLACHGDVAQELATPNSLHLNLGASAANCRTCHPEHRGSDTPLTLYEPDLYPHAEFGFFLIAHNAFPDGRPFTCQDCHVAENQPFSEQTCIDCHAGIDPGWTQAHELDFGFDCLACHDGIDTYGKRFDHQATAFPLDGRHLDLTCSDCHAGAKTLDDLRSVPTDCVGCHAKDDPHEGRLGTDCAACHTPADWAAASVDHDQTGFPLVGKHIELACDTCHVAGQMSGLPTNCVGCHRDDDPHDGKMGTDCVTCHTPEDWSILLGTFDHSRTGFPLIGAHATQACANCHIGGRFAGTPTACVACHKADDAHDGRFGTRCESCHSPRGWTPADFDHSATGFALTGGHAGVACARCHPGDRYQGTPSNCVACHAGDDAHNGQFGTDCGACHTPASWAKATFDHSKTSFPLTGAHLMTTCEACHVGGKYQGTSNRCISCHSSDDAHRGANGTECGACHDTTSWKNAAVDHNKTRFPLTGLHQGVACTQCHVGGEFRGTPMTCAACHASDDAHNGQFGTDCASCHTTAGWAKATFDHSKTAFPLTGAHASATCTQCHVNGVYKGTTTSCGACHASDDKHNGQFGTNCGACHATSSWTGATFDHSKTSFPLTGVHTSTACTKCHVNGKYDGTPTNCGACHASDDKHNGQFGSNCGACHSTSTWAGATFDHSKTSFPLTGAHTSATCTQCHVNGKYAGTPTNCVACHASDDAHNGQFGTSCGACHSTSSWSGATFDHSKTSFPLTGAHTSVTCTQCHVNGVYDGTPASCSSCHNAPSSHPGFYGSTCTQCHTTASWSVRYGGSHSFPLNHGNARSVCTTCHTNSFDAYTCYKCHDQSEMTSKHAEKGITDLSNCAKCHPNGKND